MNDPDLKQLETTKARLITGMTEYMNEAQNPGYTDADIKRCDEILREFVAGLQQPGTSASEPAILKCVKQTVLALNTLNESVGGGLIETDQREDLCEYILFAAKQSGLKQDGDVTEEWREW